MGINHKAYPPHPFITMSLIMKAMESGFYIQIPNINVRNLDFTSRFLTLMLG